MWYWQQRLTRELAAVEALTDAALAEGRTIATWPERKDYEAKEARNLAPGDPVVETDEAASALLKKHYLGKEDGIVVVRVPVKTEKIIVFLRPGTSPKVVGFED